MQEVLDKLIAEGQDGMAQAQVVLKSGAGFVGAVKKAEGLPEGIYTVRVIMMNGQQKAAADVFFHANDLAAVGKPIEIKGPGLHVPENMGKIVTP